MPAKTIDLLDAKEQLPELISLVLTGTEVTLTQDGTPLARIVPLTPDSPGRISGLHAGAISASDDFGDPLPDSFWPGEE